MRWFYALLLALLAAVFGSTQTPENYLAQRTNDYRTSHDRPALEYSGDLAKKAEQHSREMAAAGTIYHTPNSGLRLGACTLGENVGMGSDYTLVQKAFYDSPGHRSNILDRDWDKFGIGVVYKDGYYFITVQFGDCPEGTPEGSAC